jgi:alpha-tubulin suppressor-like RCC1 family protein
MTSVQEAFAGVAHTCAVSRSGGMACWGENADGQLGVASTSPRVSPIAVSRFSKGVVSGGAGDFHTCAVTVGGGVACWGDGTDGKLGDGSIVDRNVPVTTSGLAGRLGTRAAALAPGAACHTCVVTTGGAAQCWGNDSAGQLGDGGAAINQGTPVAPTGYGSSVAAIAVGQSHSCLLTNDGGVYCTGSNTYGQLGDGTTTDRSTPVVVGSLSTAASAIAAGAWHTCALSTAGAVYCWGNNSNGRLGDGTTTTRLSPVLVDGLTSGVVAIAVGSSHSCALKTDGSVWCWGQNSTGALGDGTTTGRPSPVAVASLGSGVAAVTAGSPIPSSTARALPPMAPAAGGASGR